jgi:hypothetical protein
MQTRPNARRRAALKNNFREFFRFVGQKQICRAIRGDDRNTFVKDRNDMKNQLAASRSTELNRANRAKSHNEPTKKRELSEANLFFRARPAQLPVCTTPGANGSVVSSCPFSSPAL